MRLSMISAALVAAIIGYGSTIALVLAAAQAVGATAEQTTSWVAAVCFGKAIGSACLSTWSRVPIVLAWSTPGAALIAATTGVDIHAAAGAFIAAGLAIALTALIRPLARAIDAIPASLAAAMLAGVLLPFCLAIAVQTAAAPALILPIVAVFLVVRLISPLYAVLAALAVGVGLAFAGGGAGPVDFSGFDPLPLTLVRPDFRLDVIVGLGLPLYLVTTASQNLPGFAVLRANGYEPPVRAALLTTGLGSAAAALFGAHTFNMAAITASICLGDDVHPDRSQRWRVGLAYGGFWMLLGFAGPLVVAVVLAMPSGIVATVAGLALTTPLMTAAAAALAEPDHRFPAVATLVVTASGIAVLGVGAAFWGLAVGLGALAMERAARRIRQSLP